MWSNILGTRLAKAVHIIRVQLIDIKISIFLDANATATLTADNSQAIGARKSTRPRVQNSSKASTSI